MSLNALVVIMSLMLQLCSKAVGFRFSRPFCGRAALLSARTLSSEMPNPHVVKVLEKLRKYDKKRLSTLLKPNTFDADAIVESVEKDYWDNGRFALRVYVSILDVVSDIVKNELNVLNLRTRQLESDCRGSVVLFGDTFETTWAFYPPHLVGAPSSANQYLVCGNILNSESLRFPKFLKRFLLTKLVYPEYVYMLRGSCETACIAGMDSADFTDEGHDSHYDGNYSGTDRDSINNLQQRCRTFLQSLPIAATIDDTVFVTHGGVNEHSYNLTVADINKVDRFTTPDDPIIDGLIWSMPSKYESMFGRHIVGGIGRKTVFGEDATKHFLRRNGLSMMVSARRYALKGIHNEHDGRCVTVSSSPDELYSGAVVRLSGTGNSTEATLKAEAIDVASGNKTELVIPPPLQPL